jgi:hypothetical protein
MTTQRAPCVKPGTRPVIVGYNFAVGPPPAGAVDIVLTVASTTAYLDEGSRLPAEQDRLLVA